jgi:phasin
MPENCMTPTKEAYEQNTTATTVEANLIKNGYSLPVKGVQDYNKKFIEFANANISATFDFIQRLSGVNSPLMFVELSTEYARKQFETLAEQTKQLTALAQKVTLASAGAVSQIA